jgi:hypothetical protein
MELALKRFFLGESHTLGLLYINGKFECFTLEDKVRIPFVKVAGLTAIPEGRYKVTIDMSQRFGRMMPHVLDVPQFDGIRIHPGNYAKDTKGCILVGNGSEHTDDKTGDILKSKPAFDALFPKLQDALGAKEDIYITVTNSL